MHEDDRPPLPFVHVVHAPGGKIEPARANGYSIRFSHDGAAESAAKLVGEVQEVAGDEVPVLRSALRSLVWPGPCSSDG